MAVKCSGKDFMQWYNDPAYWFTGSVPIDERTYWEDAQFFVNGEQIDEEFDFDKDLKPEDVIEVSGGVVFGKVAGKTEPSVEAYLKRWLKAQNTISLVVHCPKDKVDAIKAAIKAAGGSMA